MQNGAETPASRPTLEAFRSDVPANRTRSRNRSHFWRRTVRLPFTEPTMSSTWHDPDSLCTPSKFRKPSRTTKFSWTATLTRGVLGNDGHPWPEAGPIVFQFPFFTRSTFPDRHAFTDRLLPFLQ
jgi:hypothetical protein